ncbi:MAG: adenylate kinase family protein [Candidatus Aenigmatarchaeota archaeon]
MRLLIFGPPGSGKGTYSSRIEERIDVEHIETGDIVREMMEKNNELGERIGEYVNKGKLVPDEIINDVVKRKLEEIGMNNFILDGYPRTVEQAKFLDGITNLDVLISLDVEDEILIERLSSRRVCKNCGEVYNKLFLKPEKQGVCDKCGGELYQRDDDKPEVIKDRIETYEKKSEPVLDYFEGELPFVVLECKRVSPPVEEMVDKIMEKLREKGLVS